MPSEKTLLRILVILGLLCVLATLLPDASWAWYEPDGSSCETLPIDHSRAGQDLAASSPSIGLGAGAEFHTHATPAALIR